MKKKKVSYSEIKAQAAPIVQESAVADAEVGVFAAKTHLSSILDQVGFGKSYFITKHGKRIAEIRPVTVKSKNPVPGLWAGRMWIADDFDAPLEDFKEYME